MKIQTPSDLKQCCTCARWGGARQPNIFLSYVEYEIGAKGKCHQGEFNQQEMQGAMSGCRKWEQQYRK